MPENNKLFVDCLFENINIDIINAVMVTGVGIFYSPRPNTTYCTPIYS